MCGILGVVHNNNCNISSDYFFELLNTIERRGPDKKDFNEFSYKDLSLKLGHTRLSILDLNDTGDQPMQSHSGRFTLIYNGEIYNHTELRKRLDSKGHVSWRGTSDTETLLALFERFGVEDVLASVEGMFSFCLHDNVKNKLVLARDRTGEKPLYISTSNNFLGFSSDLNPLKKLPTFNQELDLIAVEKYLKYNYVPSPHSMFKGSFKLPVASLIEIDLNKYIIKNHNSFNDLLNSEGIYYKKWWNLSDSKYLYDLSDFSDENSIIERTEYLLSKSVKHQMIADVPLGAFLSGGIDSSLIVSLMQKSSNQTKTFTVGFDFLDFDESKYAESIASHLGTEHTTYICQEKDFFELIPNLPEAFSEPFADSSQLPTMLVSRMARKEVKVALSGDAGDELFGGYNRYLIANKYWPYINLIPSFIRNGSMKALKGMPKKTLIKFLNAFPLIPLSGSTENRLYKILDKFSRIHDKTSFYQSLTTEWTELDNIIEMNAGYEEEYLEDFKNHEISIEDAMMRADFLSYLPDDILCKVDRSSMFFSLETRAPFLNKDLIEYSYNMPLKYKVSRGEGKKILKKVLTKYVPNDLFQRPKQGFGIPVSEWMRGELKDWVNDLLSEESLNSHNLFNSSVVNTIKEEHFSGAANHEHKLWSLLQFNQWFESNKEL